MKVKTVLIVEGIADLAMMLMKLSIGLATQSIAMMSDALHSMTDLLNNAVAIIAIKISEADPDEDHHYGHRKIEQLIVFGLAMLLITLAIQIIFNAIKNYGQVVSHSQIGFIVMVGVLFVNLLLTAWQHYWARRLDSDVLDADAKHTLSDVLTTIAAILGWQFAANGYYWADTMIACLVAILVMILAIRLMKNCVPILIDYSKFSPKQIDDVLQGIEHVELIKRVRARTTRKSHFADITIAVDPELSTRESHQVTEKVEQVLAQELGIEDVIVHVEPHE